MRGQRAERHQTEHPEAVALYERIVSEDGYLEGLVEQARRRERERQAWRRLVLAVFANELAGEIVDLEQERRRRREGR